MSETSNENIQDAEKPVGNEETIEAAIELLGTKSIIIEVEMYSNGTQNINVKTPDKSTIADNLGLLHVAIHILLKDKF